MQDLNYLILTTLKEERNKVEQFVTSNNIPTLEEYKFNVGRIRGFNDAIDILLEILKGNTNV